MQYDGICSTLRAVKDEGAVERAWFVIMTHALAAREILEAS